MFFPNLISNSLIANNRSSSEEVQGKGKLGRALQDAGKARGVSGWAWWGPHQPQGPWTCGHRLCPHAPAPPRLPTGACILSLAPTSMLASLGIHVAFQPQHPPPTPLASVSRTLAGLQEGPLPPRDPGRHTSPREPCLSDRKLGKHACHVYTFTFQICLLLL